MVSEVERRQRALDIGRKDLLGAPILDGKENQRHDALGDGGVAIGQEVKGAVLALDRVEPDRRRAAPDPRRVGLERVGHRFKGAAEVDHPTITIIGLKKKWK